MDMLRTCFSQGSTDCWDFYNNLRVLTPFSPHLTYLEESVPRNKKLSIHCMLVSEQRDCGWRKPPILAHSFQSKPRAAGGKQPYAFLGHLPDLTLPFLLSKSTVSHIFPSFQMSGIITPPLLLRWWPWFFFRWENKQKRITLHVLYQNHQLHAFVLGLLPLSLCPRLREMNCPVPRWGNFHFWVEYDSSPPTQSYPHSLVSSKCPLSTGSFFSRH